MLRKREIDREGVDTPMHTMHQTFSYQPTVNRKYSVGPFPSNVLVIITQCGGSDRITFEHLRLKKLWRVFSETASSISQFSTTIAISYFEIYFSEIVKSTLINRVEGNIEICCSEMTKNLLKNLQLPFSLVHLMFPDQYSVIPIFYIPSGNWEIFGSAAY